MQNGRRTDFDVVLQLQEVVEGTEVRGFAVQNGEVAFLVVGGNRCQKPHIGSAGDQDLKKPPATPSLRVCGVRDTEFGPLPQNLGRGQQLLSN